MNDIFSPRRFWNYFLYDLNNAKNKFGLSLLIAGLNAVLIFVVTYLMSKVEGGNIGNPGWINIASSLIAFFIATVVFPVKAYGDITERRAGSSWLMIPASCLEKFLSMTLILCVLLPACLYALLIAGNAVVYVFSHEMEILPHIPGFFTFNDGMECEHPAMLTWLAWSETILAFTLGAITFKTGKTGKTILSMFVFGTLLTFVFLLVFGQFALDENAVREWLENMDEKKVELWVNIAVSIFNALMMGGLLASIFFRIKTLKH